MDRVHRAASRVDPARHGAQQPQRFDPRRAARLDDPARFAYLPPADVLALLTLAPGARLIDFGAGTGTYAVEIARTRPDVTIFALDEQPGMLDLLRAKIAASGVVNVVPIDPDGTNDLRGRADRLLALNVLHELGDAPLADLPSLLRADGYALVIDWNGDIDRPIGPPREHVYGVVSARERLERSGFSVTSTTLFAYHYALACRVEAVSDSFFG